MAEREFFESDYRFHSPVRYFTANDPYYWEVDNIPLQQLMENDLWLKDQIRIVSNVDGVDREQLNELRPYVNSTDNKVRVKPGRFTARINDITASIKFTSIVRVAGRLFNERHSWRWATYANPTIKENVDKITSEVADDVTFMNGLIERAFTYPSRDPYYPFIDYRQDPPTWNPTFPGKDVRFWSADPSESEQLVSNWSVSQNKGFAPEPRLQSIFSKFWRGVARTSIVDVAEELEIEIPAFNIADFNYIDENGDTQTRPNAEVRIDLVFIYSKPIDSLESRIIDKTSTNGVRVITKPELGIVKGAGVILDKRGLPNPANITQIDGAAQDEAGNPQILASVADSKTTAGGFSASGINGSFPSPDDLLNIAPLISEELETNDELLIGQSILPVAYVVVRKEAETNANGIQILYPNNLIDIRPFFRTAELTYAERAGIAAAIPPISLSNPVVSKLELRYETNRLHEDYTSRIASELGNALEQRHPRVVGTGYILGGSLYGPEAVLHHHYLTTISPDKTVAQLNSDILTRYGYRSDLVIPNNPNWDLSKWHDAQNLTDVKRNDWINYIKRVSEDFTYGHYSNEEREVANRIMRNGADGGLGYSDIYYVKKRINLGRDRVTSWMDDYTVNVSLLNCLPFSSRKGETAPRYPGAASIWVSKQRNSFTIYCAWVAAGGTLPSNDRDSKNFAGFVVMTDELFRQSGNLSSKYPNEAKAGIALYPSVTFEVIGYPTSYEGILSDNTGNFGGTSFIRLT